MKALSETAGEYIKIDYNTQSGKRAQYSRIAVILNLTKPLKASMMVDGRLRVIEYESLSVVCYRYIRIGHISDQCPLSQRKETMTPSTSGQQTAATEENPSEITHSLDRLGPLIQATRKPKCRPPTGSGVRPQSDQYTPAPNLHRFDVLATIGEDLPVESNDLGGANGDGPSLSGV
ncbi:hypothetical protein Syun_014655 [Stephania yunnanensis]|uniref:Zinc knuckle CX2CX4HX4C domain-containing protein n=1 Tax=Stephania yunnanensis TaxID=152371 RepID=A0AAP0PC21_9MAGN